MNQTNHRQFISSSLKACNLSIDQVQNLAGVDNLASFLKGEDIPDEDIQAIRSALFVIQNDVLDAQKLRGEPLSWEGEIWVINRSTKITHSVDRITAVNRSLVFDLPEGSTLRL